MKNSVKKEIEKLIKKEKLDYSVKEFGDKVNWNNISVNQKLSLNFIREFKDKVIWRVISWKQQLSENFIREFQDKLDWYDISRYQILSFDFILKFKDKINWNYIEKYQKITKKDIEKLELDKTKVKNKFKLIRF